MAGAATSKQFYLNRPSIKAILKPKVPGENDDSADRVASVMRNRVS